jgi:RNA polymerase sigma-70 factor (ECF subfamily)
MLRIARDPDPHPPPSPASFAVCGPREVPTSERTTVTRMDEPEDAELMRRYAAGDARAFERLYARHREALHRFLVRQTRDREFAGDLFQETWSKVIAYRDRYESRARFRTFLFHVARNCWLDALRARGRDVTWAALPIEPDDAVIADPRARGPESLAAGAAAAERLRLALADLPEAQREAFLLHEEAGLTIDEVANVTGVGAETAKSRVRYALAKLRAALADQRDALPAHGATA